MDTLTLNPPFEVEEEKYTIAVTNLEVYSSVFEMTGHNKIFTIFTQRCLQYPDTMKKCLKKK